MFKRFFVMLLLLSLSSISVWAQTPTITLDPVQLLTVEVVSERPHDTNAFTQGLLLHDDGLLYESNGRYGQSNLRALDPQTGEVLREFALPEQLFAEGLALVDDKLYQITWQENLAIVYNLADGADEGTFVPLEGYQYPGEGWGLCYDGEMLYMSDGSNTIVARDPVTFQAVSQFRVTLYGAFVDQLNELECVGEHIYANVWQSDVILRIDKASGVVDGVIDARNLLTDEQRATLPNGAVLNGIAYDPANETFLVTGKLWDTLFEVRFVPATD